ncbi:hypothetical protein M885DRAFT_524334 [Pelagophyceae sp. CCMP2097]|nr:hypothetical protein M885DRAFT_524334 [Pelagophyceae sp. CCMP2097]
MMTLGISVLLWWSARALHPSRPSVQAASRLQRTAAGSGASFGRRACFLKSSRSSRRRRAAKETVEGGDDDDDDGFAAAYKKRIESEGGAAGMRAKQVRRAAQLQADAVRESLFDSSSQAARKTKKFLMLEDNTKKRQAAAEADLLSPSGWNSTVAILALIVVLACFQATRLDPNGYS